MIWRGSKPETPLAFHISPQHLFFSLFFFFFLGQTGKGTRAAVRTRLRRAQKTDNYCNGPSEFTSGPPATLQRMQKREREKKKKKKNSELCASVLPPNLEIEGAAGGIRCVKKNFFSLPPTIPLSLSNLPPPPPLSHKSDLKETFKESPVGDKEDLLPLSLLVNQPVSQSTAQGNR